MNEWKKKTEAMKKLVAEKTADLIQKKRDLEIEAALERVRAETMAMQRSEELQDEPALLFQHVKASGAPVFSCGYNIWEKGEKEFTAWMANNDGTGINPAFSLPMTGDVNFIRFHE